MSTQISIRTSAELPRRFDAIADATGRKRSYLINQAMEEYIAREAWQVAEIRQALHEADAGNFAPDAEIQGFWDRWAKSSVGCQKPKKILKLPKQAVATKTQKGFFIKKLRLSGKFHRL